MRKYVSMLITRTENDERLTRPISRPGNSYSIVLPTMSYRTGRDSYTATKGQSLRSRAGTGSQHRNGRIFDTMRDCSQAQFEIMRPDERVAGVPAGSCSTAKRNG